MPDWTLTYDSYDPGQQGLREALCALGNGYFCTRGAFPWVKADETHYPGTYLAGGYNRLVTHVSGRDVENEDLVNMPNWLPLTFRPAGGDWLDMNACEILDFHQEVHLYEGLLRVHLRVRDGAGRETSLDCRRFVNMNERHTAGQALTITPENWTERMEIRSALDGKVINGGVKRYQKLNNTHLESREGDAFTGDLTGERMVYMAVETNQSHLRVAQAARTRLMRDGQRITPLSEEVAAEPGHVAHVLGVEAEAGHPVTVEKVVAMYCSRDTAISEPGIAARERADSAADFAGLFEEHRKAWARLWDRCDIGIADGPEGQAQLALRVHIFHLLQTVSPNSIQLDVGVPARGWHGEAYRGHIFWDELFILPLLNLRLPAVSRAMLRYRGSRLDRARLAARRAGLGGALFPWQSGSDGREESQSLHLNPRSGRWIPDNSWQQRHVNLAIAYNIWQYYVVSGEKGFLEIRGAEMLLEIARLFASLAVYDEATGRYDIHKVMGPDEYHDGYPWADEPGLSNNAYTNVMVAWLMTTVLQALDELDADHRRELMDKLGVSQDEMDHWDAMSRSMKVAFHDGDIISQFEGYGDLEEFDWEGYKAKYGDIQRLDRILEAEDKSPNAYKLSKQADVLMLFYLFSFPRLKEIFARLGYTFTEATWNRNVDYYLARTSHGSTLSYVVHTWVLARTRRADAWDLFNLALYSDIGDIQGGTTAEGIHLGAMAGTVDLVQRCFTGLDFREGALHLDPVLTERLREMTLKVRYLGNWLNITVTRRAVTITVHPSWARPVPVCVRGDYKDLTPGESYTFMLEEKTDDGSEVA